jgi:hypothetical protein
MLKYRVIRQAQWSPLAGSLLLHTVLLVAALLVWRWEQQHPASLRAAHSGGGPLVAVELRSEKKGSATPAAPAKPRAKPAARQAPATAPVAPPQPHKYQLAPGVGFSPWGGSAITASPHGNSGATGGTPSGGGGAGGPREDGFEVANAMGIEEESRLYPFFSALWKKIDASTGYPEDFVHERITGYVTAQVVVDRRGVFTGRLVRSQSDRKLLEAYALAVLFHALSEPLPEKLWSGREQVILVARFDFHTFTWGEVPPARAQKELKNVLEFERFGYTDPKLNQEIERIVTHYLPPIIPVPGGFVIDFIRAYEMIQNLRSKKLDEDDLRLERIELKKEQLEGIVKPLPGR